MTSLFPIGRLVMTANLQLTLLGENPEHWLDELQSLINRHASGDWGDLEDEDKAVNANALKNGGRLFSAYHTSGGTKLYIITEWTRDMTTCLLPEDY